MACVPKKFGREETFCLEMKNSASEVREPHVIIELFHVELYNHRMLLNLSCLSLSSLL